MQQKFKVINQFGCKKSVFINSSRCRVGFAASQKVITSLAVCLKLAQFINSFLRCQQVVSPMTWKAKSIFDCTHPIITGKFWIFIIMQKSSSLHLLILKVQPILELHGESGHTHFWACPSKRFSYKLIFHEFFAIALFCSQDKLNCSVTGQELFGLYLRNQGFSKYGICLGT